MGPAWAAEDSGRGFSESELNLEGSASAASSVYTLPVPYPTLPVPLLGVYRENTREHWLRRENTGCAAATRDVSANCS